VATRIYVGNLPYTADQQQLAQLFGAFGEVIESTVIVDRGTGQSKGFGFVQMANEDEAQNAIASLNGTMLGNRTIRVNEAQPRTERPERSGGYRSSGGGYGDRGDRGGYGGGGYNDRGGYGDRGGGGYSDRGGYGGGYNDRPRRRDEGGYGDRSRRNDYSNYGGGYSSDDDRGYDRRSRGGDRW